MAQFQQAFLLELDIWGGVQVPVLKGIQRLHHLVANGKGWALCLGATGWSVAFMCIIANIRKRTGHDSICRMNYVTSSKTHRAPPALPSFRSFHVLGRKGKRIAHHLEWFILQQRMEIESVWEFGTGRTEDAEATEKQFWSLVYFESNLWEVDTVICVIIFIVYRGK